jgi:putative phosphoribosyl transferase
MVKSDRGDEDRRPNDLSRILDSYQRAAAPKLSLCRHHNDDPAQLELEPMPFADRSDAGRRLARKLGTYRSQNPVVLALPRGGVPVAAEVARMLGAPLDLILVRKIGAPFQPELAMGAVVDAGKPLIVRNEEVIRSIGVGDTEFRAICDRELAEIERRRRAYLGDRAPVTVKGRAAIVIDDGIATGATTRAALRATRARHPSRLILAVPVAADDTLKQLGSEADDIVCLESYEDFDAIALLYDDFHQVSDREVTATLMRFAE